MISEEKSDESIVLEGLLWLKASNGKEETETVEKHMDSPDPFITIYANESCKDSAKLRYSPETLEFDIPDPYEHYEEKWLVEVYFNPSDTVKERDLKLEKIDIIEKRIEREKKKILIRKWIAIHSSTFWKELYPEEKELCRKFSYYIRVQSAEQHLKMLKHIVEEKRKKKCIHYLLDALEFHCITVCDAYCYLEVKRNNSKSWVPTAIDLLPEWEIIMCETYNLEPSMYMKAQIFMMKWIHTGQVKNKNDAHLTMNILEFTEEQIGWIYDRVMMNLELMKKDPKDHPGLICHVFKRKLDIDG